MTTAVFPLEYLDSMSCSCTSSHAKRHVYSHFLTYEDVSEYTSFYVTICTRRRPCESKIAYRHAFSQWTCITILRVGQSNVLRHGIVCEKLHTEKGS